MSSHIRAKLKEHRTTILLTATIFSVITAVLVQLFSKRIGQTPGLILGVVLSFWILSKTHEFSEKAVIDNRQDLTIKFFFRKIENLKKSLLTFATYFLLLMGFLGLIIIVEVFELSPLLLLVIMPFGFILLNAMSHAFWFKYQDDVSYLTNVKNGFLALVRAKMTIFKFAAQYLKPMIQGVIIIFLVVVFVNSFQLQDVLQLPEDQSGQMILDIFSNERSQFVQMTGTFIIMYYILFVGSALYADYFRRS